MRELKGFGRFFLHTCSGYQKTDYNLKLNKSLKVTHYVICKNTKSRWNATIKIRYQGASIGVLPHGAHIAEDVDDSQNK